MWCFACMCNIVFIIFHLKPNYGIILSKEEQIKPSYTSGIQTHHLRDRNVLLTHHNYSKVFVNNNSPGHLHYTVSRTEKTHKVYPVYNAHAYGGSQDLKSQDRIQHITSQGRGHFETPINGNKLNRTIYKRKVQLKTVDVYERCPEGATGQFVYYLNCNQFLNCWKGRGQPQTCSPGTLFNPKTLECDYQEKVDCITGPRENTLVGISSQKSTQQVLCPKEFSGRIPNYADCSKFINCNNGQQILMDCPPGTLFDINQNLCDFSYKATCFNGRSNNLKQDIYTPQHESRYDMQGQHKINSSQTCNEYNHYCGYGTLGYNGNYPQNIHFRKSQAEGQNQTTNQGYINGIHLTNYDKICNINDLNCHQNKNSNTVVQPKCPSNYQGLMKHPTDCAKFLSCANGATFIQSCSPGTLFSSVLGNCDFPYRVKCSNAEDPLDYKNAVNISYGVHSNSPKSVWPPPYPLTDVNDDYVYEYDEGEVVTLEPENIINLDSRNSSICSASHFYCTSQICISNTMVCNGHRDCENGRDERYCEQYLGKFESYKNHRLSVLENQRWINVTLTTCAFLCVESKHCKSFNYRRKDKNCYTTDYNIGLSGALQRDSLSEYYELSSTSVNCTNLYRCQNGKCITNDEVCDGVDDCGNREDEKGCKPEDFGYHIKLIGSANDYEGRIEITAFGRKGYICDDNFGILDANVICRELGFILGATEFRGNSYYAKELKENSTYYLMDDLDCFGNESTLLDCKFSGWGVHNCIPGEIAGVACKTSQQKCGKDYWKCDTDNECVPLSFVCDGLYDCTDGSDEGAQYCETPTEMRLVNGTNNKEGRIEIKHHGIWGTICDDDFNDDAGKVVCAYFGFKGLITVKKDAYFGQGVGPIWLDQVSCYGNETKLTKCTHWNWGEHNCDHGEDVGVICSNDHKVIERHSKITTRYETNTKTSFATESVVCGLRKDNQFLENDLIHARVVSGSIAKKGDYPWQAALRVRGKGKPVHWCGAVVISKTWVLTAAHCLQGYAKGAYIIVAGEYNTDEDEGTEQQKYIEEYFIHQDFRKGHKMNNDIALIKLKNEGFILNDDVQPICLPDVNADYERELNCTISGFGSVKSGTSAYSHNMRAAWIPVHNSNTCKMPHVYGTAITDGMICAGFLDGGVDSCDGDSGGPLACLDGGLFTLYGLTSWGQHCGYANKPGVYVKISHYRRWMDDIMSKH